MVPCQILPLSVYIFAAIRQNTTEKRNFGPILYFGAPEADQHEIWRGRVDQQFALSFQISPRSLGDLDLWR